MIARGICDRYLSHYLMLLLTSWVILTCQYYFVFEHSRTSNINPQLLMFEKFDGELMFLWFKIFMG